MLGERRAASEEGEGAAISDRLHREVSVWVLLSLACVPFRRRHLTASGYARLKFVSV